MDLALNNQQRLICHKTKQTKPNQTKFRNGCSTQTDKKKNQETFLVSQFHLKISNLMPDTWVLMHQQKGIARSQFLNIHMSATNMHG